MNTLVHSLKKNNQDLKISEIEGILYLLITSKGLTNAGLVRQTGLPKETLKQFKSSIRSFLVEGDDDLVELNEEGLNTLSSMTLAPYKWSVLDSVESDYSKRLEAIRNTYSLGFDSSKREFDQFFSTPITSISKANALKDKGMLSGKNIAILGDDDLVSIAIGMMFNDYTSITVLEIDDNLRATLERISNDMGIKDIQFIRYDARNEIPSELFGKFDVVITDPPYTRNGVSLFLNRATSLLKKDSGFDSSYVFLYYGNSFKSPEKTLKVQQVIGKFNYVIEDKIDKFARYYGAESIGSSSSLYVLKTTPATSSIDDLGMVENIYTFENTKEEKFPFVDHLTIKVHGVDQRLLTSKKNLQKVFGEFCNIHKLRVVDQFTTGFKKQGFSLTYILSSSNLLVHTWPEYNAIHIDLVTCSPIYNKDNISATLYKLLGTRQIEVNVVE